MRTVFTREEAQDMADAHSDGCHEDIPREGCPDCEGRELSSYPPAAEVATPSTLSNGVLQLASDALVVLDSTLEALHEILTADDGMAIDDPEQEDMMNYTELNTRRDRLVEQFRALVTP